MQDRRKRDIRIEADSFRANCKIGKYGIIDLFEECKRVGYKLLRYPLGENADLGFMKKRIEISLFLQIAVADFREKYLHLLMKLGMQSYI